MSFQLLHPRCGPSSRSTGTSVFPLDARCAGNFAKRELTSEGRRVYASVYFDSTGTND